MVCPCGCDAIRCTQSSVFSPFPKERNHHFWAVRSLCVSEVSVDVPEAESCLARPRVHDRPMAPQFSVSFRSCSTGGLAFDAELAAALQNLLYGMCWLHNLLFRLAPERPCHSLMFVIDGTRLSSYLVDAAMQVGYGEAA